ncbi:YihY/virulence factor BrkB family protein [Haloflavibacter putidus]|uniref:YihY/virulence factor BrkB family protein n=1 Tax=Haloflavibacter putidus TaxID=2576776 RepID=A0A507ZWT1_9FLAO|nr:YihY/virulence factor BrkB family protein [Haloflavibacter putidus]TQD40158.1 YihY/virulence factor BrkB family protein [Haloflavibacter putidus]
MKEKLMVLKKTYQNWMKNDPFQHSAVVAYYTLFSLPSLLLIVTWIAGYFFERSNVEEKLINEIADIIGPETATSIQSMVEKAAIEDGSFFTLIISIGVLVFGATGAFFQLKQAMNNIWSVRPKNENIKGIILDRVISLGMIFVIGFLMLVSLVVTTLISYLSDYISVYAPELTSYGVAVINFLLSYIFIGFLFASIIRLLPDIKIKWKTTFIGASLTTILFLIGKYVLSFYFGQSNPASVYGGASSVVLILLWVYYSCMILFFGAEFTVQYALYKNEDIQPSKLAEPAYYQELEELKQKRRDIEHNKKDLDKLSP